MSAAHPIPAGTFAPSADERAFRRLSEEQMSRIGRHGSVRGVTEGEVLLEAGERSTHFYVVRSGHIDITNLGAEGETLVARHDAGQFTGEVNMLAGRPSFVRIRAGTAGEVIELERDHLLDLVQTDSELSEILMRAFLLRRVQLIDRNLGDVVLLGSRYCPDTLRVREFLTRNGHPHIFLDLEQDEGVQELLDRFDVATGEMPVIIWRCDTVLRNPVNSRIAEALGFNDAIDQTQVRDLVIIGGGPSGLAAAVYGSSEGLDVLVVESSAPAVRPVPARGSRTTSSFRLASPAGISPRARTIRRRSSVRM